MSKPGDNKNGPKSVAEKAKFVRSHRKQKAPYKIFAIFLLRKKHFANFFVVEKIFLFIIFLHMCPIFVFLHAHLCDERDLPAAQAAARGTTGTESPPALLLNVHVSWRVCRGVCSPFTENV